MLRPQIVGMKFQTGQKKKPCEDGGFWGLCIKSAKMSNWMSLLSYELYYKL